MRGLWWWLLEVLAPPSGEVNASPSGFKGDAGGIWAPPSLVVGVVDLTLSPFGVLPSCQATKSTSGVSKETLVEAAFAPPDAAIGELAASLWMLLSGFALGLGAGAGRCGVCAEFLSVFHLSSSIVGAELIDQ